MKRTLMLVLLGAFVLAGLVDTSQACTIDLTGGWYGHYIGLDSGGNGTVASIFLELNGDGTVASGTVTPVGGAVDSGISGRIESSDLDELSGAVKLGSGVTLAIGSGKLSNKKNFLNFVFAASDGRRGEAVLYRSDGSFVPSDLAGEFRGYGLQLVSGKLAGVQRNSLVQSAAGAFLSGTYAHLGGASGSYLTSTVAVTAAGNLTGSATTDTGQMQSVLTGRYSDFRVVGTWAARSPGEDNLFMSLDGPTGGSGLSFTNQDLGGTWYGTAVETGTAPKVFACRIQLDTAAKVVEGEYDVVGGVSGAVSSGAFSVTAGGAVSGQYVDDAGVTVTVAEGLMDRYVNEIALMYSTSAGAKGRMLLVKGPQEAAQPEPEQQSQGGTQTNSSGTAQAASSATSQTSSGTSQTSDTTRQASGSSSGSGGCVISGTQEFSPELLLLGLAAGLLAARRKRA